MRVQWSSGRGFHQLPPRLQIRSTARPSLLRTLRISGYDQTPEHNATYCRGAEGSQKPVLPNTKYANGDHVKAFTHWFRAG